MSPQPEMTSFHGWARLNETSFLLKVQKSNGFQRLIGTYSKAFGVALDDDNLQSFAEEIGRCCLREADDIMFADGPLAAALQEVQHYKQKLVECNLTAMKQITAMRDGCHLSEELKEDTVMFHEPLNYMDEAQQRLVIAVVCDKLRQLERGTAPQSLVDALTRYAEALLKQEEGAGMDELLEVQSGLQKMRVQKKAVQARLEHAETESSLLKKELEEVRSALSETAKAYEELREQEPVWHESIDELRDLSEHQKAEIAQQRVHVEHLVAAVERREAEIEELSAAKDRLEERGAQLEAQLGASDAELSEARQEAQRGQAEAAQLRRSLAEQQRQAQAVAEALRVECVEQQVAKEELRDALQRQTEQQTLLQQSLDVLQARHEALALEAAELQEELRRRNATQTQESQTEICGPDLQQEQGEASQLRVVMEELQMRVRDMIERYRQRFGSEAKEMAADLGMDELLREQTAFQRLYDDGLLRVNRLEQLREKVRRERNKLGLTADRDEVSVLAAVEKSDLRGLRQMLQAGRASNADGIGFGEATQARGLPEARSLGSVSLPTLHTSSSSFPVKNLKLDSSQKGYRRSTKT
ncbi:unnamed protein product [Effrenium voratum]|nr:unnamed protein product [Effrenium voratum]